MSGHHGLSGQACILDLTGQTGHHIDNTGGLTITVPPYHVFSSCPVTPHPGHHILHPSTADTLILGVRQWKPGGNWSGPGSGGASPCCHTGGLPGHYWDSGTEILHSKLLTQ